MRIAILGNSGSGKSTLAREIAKVFGLPTLDLDTVAWVPGQVAVARDRADALADVAAFCAANEGWVMEGCYAGLVQAALPFQPLLLFVDPGMEACLANAQGRPWEPHKYASKEAQDGKLAFLLAWIRGYDTREGELGRDAHEALFQGYPGPRHRLTTRVDSAFIHALPRLTQAPDPPWNPAPREASMSPASLEHYLYDHIPLSKAIQVSVIEVGDEALILKAPLQPNINHRDTVFGGSASALAILAAWSLLHRRLRSEGFHSRLVIQRNTMEYERPIPGEFTARASLHPQAEWASFLRMLTRKGKARITVIAVLEHRGQRVGCFSGEFVALDGERGKPFSHG